MASVKRQALELFEQLPEQEQLLVLELLKRLAPDDIATEDDLLVHAAAIEEYKRGETVDMKDVDWS